MAFLPDLLRRLERLLSGGSRSRWASSATHGRVSRRRGALKGRGWPRQAGSTVVIALVAGLIGVIGVLLLAARLFTSRFNSASRGDLLAAREAAEYGLHELQAQLNTNQRGYLWVTKQASWTNANLLAALNTCNVQALDSSGTPLSALPALPDGITASKTIRTVNDTTISYQLNATNGFQPPELPNQDATTVKQEAACGIGSTNAVAAANFGNLNGGSALITVTGTVSRGTGTNARKTNFTLRRRVHVLSPSQELKFSFVITGNAYSATACSGTNRLGKSLTFPTARPTAHRSPPPASGRSVTSPGSMFLTATSAWASPATASRPCSSP